MKENITESYKRNNNLEFLLKELNSIIKTKYSNEDQLNLPVLFIVGTARSGTTLFTQWLASLNLFSFPTNFVSRFYSNPYLGYIIQEMLYNKDFSFKNELQINFTSESFKSDVGKTTGPLEPHEFWYFWREHFEFPENPVTDDEFLKNADFDTFSRHIAKVQTYFEKPFFLKSLIINWYINLFYKNIPNAMFLYIKRDPLDNMKSLLDVRNKFFSNEDLWYSFRPREYNMLVKENKYIQVAGQVEFTNREIEEQLKDIPENNKIEINYSQFCENPSLIYEELRKKIKTFNVNLPNECPNKNNFSKSVSIRTHEPELINAYNHIKTLIK